MEVIQLETQQPQVHNSQNVHPQKGSEREHIRNGGKADQKTDFEKSHNDQDTKKKLRSHIEK